MPDIDTAAAIVGADWANRRTLGRSRAITLLRQFPNTTSANAKETHALLRAAIRLTELDFDILCLTADWFAEHRRLNAPA